MLEACLPEYEGRGEVLARRATSVDGSAPGGDPQRLRPIFSATPVGPPYAECTQHNRHKRVEERNVKVSCQSLDPVQVRCDVIGMA